jgi:predicted nucleotidyltransferase
MSEKISEKKLIEDKLKGLFVHNELMFAYFCGSRAYGTDTKDSDIDVVAVFSDLGGITHATLSGIDIFAYGIDSFIQRQSISDELPLYNLIHADDFIKAKDNLIYLNPKYKTDFDKLVKIDFSKVLPEFLEAFIKYYDLLINVQQAKVKRSYHIYRVKGLIDNYKKNGKYEINLSKEQLSKIADYKKNWESLENSVVSELSDVLEEIKEFKENLKVGDKNED